MVLDFKSYSPIGTPLALSRAGGILMFDRKQLWVAAVLLAIVEVVTAVVVFAR